MYVCQMCGSGLIWLSVLWMGIKSQYFEGTDQTAWIKFEHRKIDAKFQYLSVLSNQCHCANKNSIKSDSTALFHLDQRQPKTMQYMQ